MRCPANWTPLDFLFQYKSNSAVLKADFKIYWIGFHWIFIINSWKNSNFLDLNFQLNLSKRNFHYFSIIGSFLWVRLQNIPQYYFFQSFFDYQLKDLNCLFQNLKFKLWNGEILLKDLFCLILFSRISWTTDIFMRMFSLWGKDLDSFLMVCWINFLTGIKD